MLLEISLKTSWWSQEANSSEENVLTQPSEPASPGRVDNRSDGEHWLDGWDARYMAQLT